MYRIMNIVLVASFIGCHVSVVGRRGCDALGHLFVYRWQFVNFFACGAWIRLWASFALVWYIGRAMSWDGMYEHNFICKRLQEVRLVFVRRKSCCLEVAFHAFWARNLIAAPYSVLSKTLFAILSAYSILDLCFQDGSAMKTSRRCNDQAWCTWQTSRRHQHKEDMEYEKGIYKVIDWDVVRNDCVWCGR